MKYLPSEIEINGVTYYSGLELASKQLDWYNLGLAAGKSEGYKEGYTTGFDNGLDAATIANTKAVKPSPCNHGECIAGKEEAYDDGYKEGYEEGKKSNGISTKEMPSEYLTPTEESFYKGYKEGFDDCREITKMLNKYGGDEDGVE